MNIRRSFLALAALAVAAVSFSAEPGWVIITGDVCNIRSKPDAGSSLVVQLQKFAPVERMGEKEGEYWKVRTRDGKTGYAHEKYVGSYGYASAKPGKVNWRKAPSKDAPIEYEMTPEEYYPVRVLDRQGDYVQIQDFEKDKGWLSASVLTTQNYCIVSVEKADVRVGAGDTFDVAFHAAKGVYLQVKNQQGDWLEVKYKDGNSGWIKASSVWGAKPIAPDDMPPASKPAAASSPVETESTASEPAESTEKATSTAEKKTDEQSSSSDEKSSSSSEKKSAKGKSSSSKKNSTESNKSTSAE